MKIIVTHKSPDIDAITSIWLIKKFLPGWDNANVSFVSAGDKLQGQYEEKNQAIEKMSGNEVIHVDTGLGMLDHHQVDDMDISAASLTLEFLRKSKNSQFPKSDIKIEAITRMIRIVVEEDHFKDYFRPESLADYHDFSVISALDGYKMDHPGEDEKCVEFGIAFLDTIFHSFENKVWAEKEIKDKGIEFDTRWGKALGIETVNDDVLKYGQKKGYVIVVRRDPQSGFVRIKARPRISNDVKDDIDLTHSYEVLRKKDPEATWFLHISKKMLLNGSYKNPEVKVTKLSLNEIIEVLKNF